MGIQNTLNGNLVSDPIKFFNGHVILDNLDIYIILSCGYAVKQFCFDNFDIKLKIYQVTVV